ncbi:hypothetical protein OH738_33745 [Streptomyces hirsutus]|uniref:hypothetical protein n=1 Tax=Streptomyces hirsutus TaxID=35620 RepID=UPI00386A99B1|nr:hypothetical protein OH738_33745 [Streptomyces hirsutus]
MTTREEVSGVEGPPPVTNTPEGHLPYSGGWFCLALSRELVEAHQDLRIWNTERHVPRPRLAASDEVTGFFRHGDRQFHPSP